MTLSLSKECLDPAWGCAYHAVLNAAAVANIKLALVRVKSLHDFASQITGLVLDTSWMTALNPGTKRAYETTVSETAAALVAIFKQTDADGTIGAEFGEVMVSIGSSRALQEIFSHSAVPIAELWKPQVKQNEGFDFHTVCPSAFINFGEAKYSGKKSPHGLAITQADDFITAKKHLRDRIHLQHLVAQPSLDHLDSDTFGIVAAFSLNALQPLVVLQNALIAAQKVINTHKVASFYLVGVTDEC